MYTAPHIPAAIASTIALVGWVVQGFGNAYFYQQVRQEVCNNFLGKLLTLGI
jgi:hypothetical protein